jgi:hypothetical protein
MERVRHWVGRHADLGSLALAGLILAATMHQLYASKTGTLTPWKGGGFGMYTAPHGSARAVFVMLGDRPMRLAPADEGLEAWIKTLDLESAAFLNGLISRATALRNFPRDAPAAQLMADVARVHWDSQLAGAGGLDGLFRLGQLRVVVSELARKPVAGVMEQRVIFTAGGN